MSHQRGDLLLCTISPVFVQLRVQRRRQGDRGYRVARQRWTGGEDADEITEFIHAHYLGSYEVAWRIFEFGLTARRPSGMHLAAHTPIGQTVFYQEGHGADRIQDNAAKPTLTALLRTNTTATANCHDVGVTFLFCNFLVHYTWDER